MRLGRRLGCLLAGRSREQKDVEELIVLLRGCQRRVPGKQVVAHLLPINSRAARKNLQRGGDVGGGDFAAHNKAGAVVVLKGLEGPETMYEDMLGQRMPSCQMKK